MVVLWTNSSDAVTSAWQGAEESPRMDCHPFGDSRVSPERIRMNEHKTTTVPEEIKDCVCVHDIVPEVVPNPQGAMDAMKIRVIGHKTGEPHANDELFALLTGLPNAAVFASRILESVSDANEFSQVMVAIVLSRELAKDDPKRQGDDVFGDDEPVAPSKGYAKNATDDDPVRIMKFDGEPSRTFAPIDNRDEFPEGMNGYL